MALRRPLDRTLYERDPRSVPLSPLTPDGRYVYVVDSHGTIFIVPDDGPHLHPKVLGGGERARYAGELVIDNRMIVELTNCSGTFQFASERGLLETAHLAAAVGFPVAEQAVIFHYFDRISRPKVLRYPRRRARHD